METDPDPRIEVLAREKLEGKSYSKIREELGASGMPPEEIGRLIRQVDERVLRETVELGVGASSRRPVGSGSPRAR